MIVVIVLLSEVAAALPVNFTAAEIPGEGRPLIEVQVSSVRLYSEPSRDSEIVETRSAEAPVVVAWRVGFTRTIRPGTLMIRSNVLATAYDFGKLTHLSGTESWSKPVEVLFNEGSPVEYLLYLGEGSCVVRYHESVLATNLCESLFSERGSVELTSQPEYEIWFDIGFGDAPAKWLMLEAGVVEWVCTEPYTCDGKSDGV